jgi:valyl-tRNA synthetase
MHQPSPPADTWILASCRAVLERVTAEFTHYDYAAAKSEIENFFWRDLCDNYLEMAKLRLYDAGHPGHAAACWALRQMLLVVVKLLAPLLPYVTETIYQAMFATLDGSTSVHRARWPQVGELCEGQNSSEAQPDWASLDPLASGELLIAIATSVRRYKSTNALSLGSEVTCLHLSSADPQTRSMLAAAAPDLSSVTRARSVQVNSLLATSCLELPVEGQVVQVGIEL